MHLENLTKKINEDAEIEAKAILQTAEKNKAAIIAQKNVAANEKVASMLKRAETNANLTKEQIISSAHIKVRDEQLSAKREVIERVFQETLKRLSALDDEEYIQFLQNRLKEKNWNGTERIVVPKNKQDIVQNIDLPLPLSDEEVVESGFMIIDDQYMINYSFPSILEFYRDDLELAVAQLLFQS